MICHFPCWLKPQSCVEELKRRRRKVQEEKCDWEIQNKAWRSVFSESRCLPSMRGVSLSSWEKKSHHALWTRTLRLFLLWRRALWDNDVTFVHMLWNNSLCIKREEGGRRRGLKIPVLSTLVLLTLKGSFKGQWVINFLSPATMICCDILSLHSSEALNINWEVRWVKRL